MCLDYLNYRITSTAYLGEKINEYGVPVLLPPGGQAIYIDASIFLPNIPKENFPGQALACSLYLEGGIRTSEIGSVMCGDNSPHELVRLAIPRRTYTQSHFDYVAEVLEKLVENKDKLKGYEITEQSRFLRHFTAKLKPLS